MSLRDQPIELAEALLRSYKAPISAFVDVAEHFCTVVTGRSTYTQVGFLEAIEPPLAELYVRAIALPDTSLWFSEDDNEVDDTEESRLTLEEGTHTEQVDVYAEMERMRQEREAEFPILASSYVHPGEQMAITRDIEALLGDLNLYQLVFDPYGDGESGESSLGDDIASIFAPLASYLPLFKSRNVPAMREALWNWRFGFDNHEMWHLTGALRAIHWLIHSMRSHWDGDAWDDGRLVPSRPDQ